MKILLLSLLLSLSAEAALKLKPGKWKIDSTIISGGKEFKPERTLSKLTPEQRKQMEAVMKAKGAPHVSADGNAMIMCYTKEMLNSGLGLKEDQEKRNCQVSDHQTTDHRVSMTFKCTDGSHGNSVWTVVDDEHLSGTNTIIASNGKKSEMKYKAEFLTANCR